jgi:hypothetical protein
MRIYLTAACGYFVPMDNSCRLPRVIRRGRLLLCRKILHPHRYNAAVGELRTRKSPSRVISLPPRTSV